MICMFKVIHHCYQMYLRTFEIRLVKYMNSTLLVFLKITKVKLDCLTDMDMLLMVEKGISGGICHAIHQYAKSNNK